MGTQNQRLLSLLSTPYSLVPLLFDEGREFKATWTSQGSVTIVNSPNSLDLVPRKVSSSYFWENLRFTDIPLVLFLSPVCVHTVCVHACTYSVVSDSLQPHGLSFARLLCPRNFPGKNIEVSCHFLLQAIFPTQGSNLRLLCILRWQVGSLPSLAPPGKPKIENIFPLTLISKMT